MKKSPHEINPLEEIEKALNPGEDVEDVAVVIPDEELEELKKMNRRARKRWLEKKGITQNEFRERT